MTVTVISRDLRARSVAFALLADVLGPDTRALADPATLDTLSAALTAAGEERVLTRLAGVDPHVWPSSEVLAGQWVRWFDLGRVAPYEGSNVAASAGGVTPQLADVAGFYRAFGMEVSGDRPDHVVAQLEFLAYALLVEAEATEAGDAEHIETTTAAVRMFLRDHLGMWIDAWAARVGAIDELSPWAPFAAAAAELVRTEAAHHHVVPLRDAPVLLADAGIPDDDERILACEDDAVTPWDDVSAQ